MKKPYKSLIYILLAVILAAGVYEGYRLIKLPSPVAAIQTTPTPTPQKQKSADNIFSLNYSSEYGINPLNGLNKLNQLESSLVYEGLFVLDGNFNYHPVLCESFTTTGGTSYNFIVKGNVTFQDGTPLTAYDVAYSLNQAKKSDLYGARFSSVANIAAYGSSTVTVNLSKPDMTFPSLLDIPVIKSGEINTKNPVGTGPYMLSSESGSFCLNAYPGWRGYQSLTVKRIYLQEYKADDVLGAFEGSYIDLAVTDPQDVTSINIKGNFDMNYFDTTYLQYIGFNMQSAVFSNSEIRRAVGYTVNRDYIAGSIMSYAATVTSVPTLLMKDTLASIINESSYSQNKAMEVLNANGITFNNKDGLLENKDGGKYAIKFIADKDNPYKLAAAKSIADSLSKLGFSVDFQQLTWNNYVGALEKGDFDMYYAETKLTPEFDLSSILKSGGSLNYGGIRDNAYGVLIDAFLAADGDARKAAAQALYGDIAKTAPIVPVVFRRQAMVSKRGVVTGSEPSMSNTFYGIEKWKINLG